jgi:WD40 repeat protein
MTELPYEKYDPKTPESGFLGECPPDMECPLAPKEPEAIPDKEIVALYRTYHGHEGSVLSLAVSPDSKTALSGSADTTMRLWDLENGSNKPFPGHANDVSCVAFVKGGMAISGSWDNTLIIWDLKMGVRKHVINGFDFYIRSMAASQDGHHALVGSGDKKLRYLDLETGDPVFTMTGHLNVVSAVAFVGPDTAISGSWDRSINLWDLKTGKYVRSFEGHMGYIYSIAVSADDKYFLSGSGDKTLKYWDIATGECLKTLVGHGGHVKAVALTPDGQYAVSGGSDKLLKVWDLKSGLCLQTIAAHDDAVNALAMAPDGHFVLSGSRDKTIMRWEFI